MTTSIADPLFLVLDSKGAETTSWNSRSPSNLLIGSRLRTRRVSYGLSEEELRAISARVELLGIPEIGGKSDS